MLLLACRVARVRALQAPLKKFGRLRALASTVAEYEALEGVEKVEDQNKSWWTLRWLRIAELVKQNTVGTKLTFCTLPFPRSFLNSANYMGWLEILSNGKEGAKTPFVMIRGNGHDCITNKLE